VAPNLAPPPGGRRFPLFDALRAIAALLVFAGHLVNEANPGTHPDVLTAAVLVAREGVAVFFLISGFLLYRPFVAARSSGRRIGLIGYARRRVLRIVPAYWVALAVLSALGLIYGVGGSGAWRYYAFAQIYSVGANAGEGISASWSLCVEVVFYAALPVLALAGARLGSPRRELGALAVLGVISCILRAGAAPALPPHHGALSPTMFVYDLAFPTQIQDLFLWFALGMGLAVVSVARENAPARATGAGREPGRSVSWPLLSWIAAAVCLVLQYLVAVRQPFGPTIDTTAVHVLMGATALGLLVPAVFAEESARLPARILRSRLLTWIGLVSYGFYLYHGPLLHWIHERLGTHLGVGGFLLLGALAFASSCAAAALSYYVLERPLLRLARGLPRPRTRPPAPAPPAVEMAGVGGEPGAPGQGG
jgi:peptidoglycan/LPS O-acetylase OafA/YrhL